MEKVKSNRQTYSKEFKLNAIKMTTSGGLKASEVARNLGLHENLIYNWIRQHKEDAEQSFPGQGVMKERDDYVRKLEKENMRLKAERDILKKAALFFAKEE